MEMITTEGVGIDLGSLDNTSYVENIVTSTFASTMKGRLIKLLLLLSFINVQFNARQSEECHVFSPWFITVLSSQGELKC